jgi:RNA polymerase sigma-70 factor (ECF subfamily)
VSGDDRRLITECLQGRTAAFGELVCRYQDRLFNTVYRVLDNAEDAQDAVQDAFLTAYLSLDRFKGNSLFFTWLYRIAVNTAFSMKRKQRAAISMSEGGDGLEPVDQSPYGQPGYALEQAENQRLVQDALNRLSAQHRTVLIMQGMEGQKYETMAEVLGVPIGTIRSRLHRARLELREALTAGRGTGPVMNSPACTDKSSVVESLVASSSAVCLVGYAVRRRNSAGA